MVGARGGIGSALLDALVVNPAVGRVIAASRTPSESPSSKVETVRVDVCDETSIVELAEACRRAGDLDLVLVATGILHDGNDLRPEKQLADIEADKLARVFSVNSIGPIMVAKHLLPLLARDRASVFAALSARVGSIADNRLGGWYSYRASKAALNMLIRTAAIELRRTHPTSLCIGLHPGTVATPLSEPFSRHADSAQVAESRDAACRLLDVIAALGPDASGRCYAWDGSEVPP